MGVGVEVVVVRCECEARGAGRWWVYGSDGIVLDWRRVNYLIITLDCYYYS